jgi:hypothetical protein
MAGEHRHRGGSGIFAEGEQVLPPGSVSHSLARFPPSGWQAWEAARGKRARRGPDRTG